MSRARSCRYDGAVTLSLDDVRAAAERLSGVAHRTPVLTSRTLDERTGATAFLKAESLQRGGAFKFRGAYNMISSLGPDEREAASSPTRRGTTRRPCRWPPGSSGRRRRSSCPPTRLRAKLEATMGYGAEVVTYDRYTEDREALGAALADERGLVLVPPYEHPLVMAGQGTAALELLEDVPGLDVLLVPVGGGGLIAGCATAAKALRPGIRVVGVEPEAGDDTRRSLEAGERVRIPVPRTIADGQQADIPGELTFAVNRQVVDTIVTVSDTEIVDAMAFLFDRMKLVTEPSGASAAAALLAGRAATAAPASASSSRAATSEPPASPS